MLNDATPVSSRPDQALFTLRVCVSVRGPAHLPGRGPDVGDRGQVSGDQVLHGSDRHQTADEVRQRAGAEVSVCVRVCVSV